MLRALLLAALALAPAALAAFPEEARGVPPPLFVRQDPDGGRTLLLLLEDEGAGAYEYRATPVPGGSDLREVGTYTHPWTWNGKPEVTLGVYGVSATQGLVRVPVLILENAADQGALVASLQDGLARGRDVALGVQPFLAEALAPEVGDPADPAFERFTTEPLLVAWHARRALPGAEAWLGTYLDRQGEAHAVDGGREGARSVELGSMARADGEDARLAGVWVEQRASLAQQGGQRAMSSTFTAGLRTPAGRTPLAAVHGADARDGAVMAQPDHQTTTFTLGAHGPDGFVPLVGARTQVTNRAHPQGTEVTRLTAFGAYADGAFVPAAGLRTHSDRRPITEIPNAFLAGGALGSNQTGDAEVSVGAFVDGRYEPLAQATLDDAFAGGSFEHQTMVSLGVVTPLGFARLASASYDGTHSLVDWALAAAGGTDRGSQWLVAAGPWVGQLYHPVVGVRYQGEAPGSERAHESEVAVGTFLGGYPGFVPLLAASASSDEAYPAMAARQAGQGLGNQGGSWQANAGTYGVNGIWVPLVEVLYQPVSDPDSAAASDLVVRVAGQPALGVQYRGEAPLMQSYGNPLLLNDDAAWRASVGLYGPLGYVPLLRLAHDSDSTTVTVGPDL